MGELSLRRMGGGGIKSAGYSGSLGRYNYNTSIGTAYSIYSGVAWSGTKSLFDNAKNFIITSSVENSVCTFVLTKLEEEVQATYSNMTLTARLHVDGTNVYLQIKSTQKLGCTLMAIPIFQN